MPLNIVFMGTPDFAVPCLARILAEGHRVAGVFSQPDKPKGRGYQTVPTPVKALALTHNLPVFQPASLRGEEAAQLLRELNADAVVVVAYGKLLPKALLEVPPLGCVNVHASLLPHLRGAAPIQRSIIGGDTTTGVTTMYMAEGMDTGDMILRRETPIGEKETAGELFERLAAMGAELLAETLRLIEQGTAPRTPQNEELATHAPMITKQTAALDFTAEPKTLCNLVRGLNPSPCGIAKLNGKQLKIHEAVPVQGFLGEPGAVLHTKRFIVGCGNGAVELLRVQPEGKRVMEGSAFLCGLREPLTEKLEAFL